MEAFKQKLESTSLNPKTQYIYLNEVKKYLNNGNKTLVKFNNEKNMVKYIDKNYATLNQKNQITKSVIKWRQLAGKQSDVLSEYLTKNVAEYTGKLQNKYETEESKLPSIEEYKKYVDELYEKKEWKKYVINRLIGAFQVRNKDLDLTITKNKNEIDDERNWLLVEKMKQSAYKVTYIRNDYKTKDVYGQKVDRINLSVGHKMYHALDEIIKSGNPKLITEKNIARTVVNATNGIGEGDLFKMMMKEASFKDAKVMSENRGTDLETIAKHYDIK